MNGNVKYPNLRRSVEKNLTRKTDEKERSFMKWLIKKANTSKLNKM
ncbi:hypothetical protein [Halalkalibacter okhensis]|nr:hypothetical protein [Halalkalibacter okhensis]